MGHHKEWRKIAKKFRRKRIRKKCAIERDEKLREEEKMLKSCPQYQTWLYEQQLLDKFAKEEEERVANEAKLKWEAEERLAQERWRQKQELAKQEAEVREKQQALIREEWEKEQKQKLKEEEKKKLEEERKKEEMDRILAEMDLFISGELRELPSELNVSTETQPGKEICPFFQKVGACRFKTSCSRNHVRPGISKCILMPGFYSHFSLSSSNQAEYDTDISLEYDTHEQYKHFRDFYDDIKDEFLKFGKIDVLKVCSNEEPHLRGNVYVQFREERSAMSAFRGLNGRYYAGKRISVEFVNIPNWNRAICGLQFRKACPKGRVCNFLHVFRNPHGEYTFIDDSKKAAKEKEWKWSDSSDSDDYNRDRHNNKRNRSHERRSRSQDKKNSRHSERSRLREKSRTTERRSHSKEFRKSKARRKKRKKDKYESERMLRNGT